MFSQLCYTLVDMLTNTNVISSMILIIFGLALSILASRITKAVRKTSEISSDDKLLLILRAIGLVFMIIGLIIMLLALILMG